MFSQGSSYSLESSLVSPVTLSEPQGCRKRSLQALGQERDTTAGWATTPCPPLEPYQALHGWLGWMRLLEDTLRPDESMTYHWGQRGSQCKLSWWERKEAVFKTGPTDLPHRCRQESSLDSRLPATSTSTSPACKIRVSWWGQSDGEGTKEFMHRRQAAFRLPCGPGGAWGPQHTSEAPWAQRSAGSARHRTC